jgi:hypothetical protein
VPLNIGSEVRSGAFPANYYSEVLSCSQSGRVVER